MKPGLPSASPLFSAFLLFLSHLLCGGGTTMSVASMTSSSPASSAATRTILISGANRGIGLEVVRQLLRTVGVPTTGNGTMNDNRANAPLTVIATARDPSHATELHKLAKQTTTTTTTTTDDDGLLQIEALDVTSTQSMQALAQRLSHKGKKIHVLINNAGIYTGGANPVHDAATMMNVNYYGPKHLTRILRKDQVLAQNALIINVSSGMGALSGFANHAQRQLTDPSLTEELLDDMVQHYIRQDGQHHQRTMGWPADVYSASKGALNAWVRISQRNTDPKNPLNYCCVCPGWVQTEMGGSSAPRSVQQGADTMVWLARQHCHDDASDTQISHNHNYGGRIFRDRQEIEW